MTETTAFGVTQQTSNLGLDIDRQFNISARLSSDMGALVPFTLASGSLLCGSIDFGIRHGVSFLTATVPGAMLLSITRLVHTATSNIFDLLGLEEGTLRSCLTWTFTVLCSTIFAVAAIKGFGMASTISDALLLLGVAILGGVGLCGIKQHVFCKI